MGGCGWCWLIPKGWKQGSSWATCSSWAASVQLRGLGYAFQLAERLGFAARTQICSGGRAGAKWVCLLMQDVCFLRGAALIVFLRIKGWSLPCYIIFLCMYMQRKPYSKSFIYTCSFLASRALLHHIWALSTWDTDTWRESSLSLSLRVFIKSLVLVRLCLLTYIVVVLH